MSRYKKKNPALLAPLATLLVACVGCPSQDMTAAASRSQYPQAAPSAARRTVPMAPAPTTRTTPAPTSTGPNIPALISGQDRRQTPAPSPSRRVTPAPAPSLTDPRHPNNGATGPLGLPMLQPSEGSVQAGRTNLVPQVISNLPETPAAAVQARVRIPEGTEPAQPSGPSALYGLVPGGNASNGALAGIPQIPLYGLSRRDKARAFYTAYVKDWQDDYAERSLFQNEAGVEARKALRQRIETGRLQHPDAYTAFADLVEPHWSSTDEPSAFRWLLSDRSFTLSEVHEDPTMGKVDDAHRVAQLMHIFANLFPDAPTLAEAATDLDPQTARLVDPMSAQDFYNQYLRQAHKAYEGAPGWFDLDETNDFAEALATGLRANPVGFEALAEQVEGAADGQDVLNWLRHDWNNYLRLLNGHGGDAEIDRSGREPKVGGKTREQWKDQAEANMRKVSRALARLF